MIILFLILNFAKYYSVESYPLSFEVRVYYNSKATPNIPLVLIMKEDSSRIQIDSAFGRKDTLHTLNFFLEPLSNFYKPETVYIEKSDDPWWGPQYKEWDNPGIRGWDIKPAPLRPDIHLLKEEDLHLDMEGY